MLLYDVLFFGELMRDRVRVGAYQKALQKTLAPGDVAVDLGAGAGIMTLLACRLGAGKVHAIDPNPAIQVAREVVEVNGFSDRVEFHETLSTRVDITAPADVLVSDLHGVLPLFEKAIPAIIDARLRLLKPGGFLIPQIDTIWAAPVEAPILYADYDEAWREANLGFNFEPARRRAINVSGKCRLPSSALLADPVRWAVLDYRTIEKSSFAATVEFKMGRPGLAHGFALWFDSILCDGVALSNGPGEPRLIYGQCFFPFQEPIPVVAGARLNVDIRADLVRGDYIWQWTTVAVAPSSSEIAVKYCQSSFFSGILSPDQLRKMSEQHAPVLNKDGLIYRRALDLMHEGQALSQIGKSLSIEFPGRFSDLKDAIAFVGDLSSRFAD